MTRIYGNIDIVGVAHITGKNYFTLCPDIGYNVKGRGELMKNIFLISIIIASIGLVGCGSDSTDDINKESNTATKGVAQSSYNENTYELKDNFTKGVVDNIMDGDSLYINWSKDGVENNTQFYLEGIDAPEIEHPVYNKMPYGDEAKQNLEDLVSPGDEVYIEFIDEDLTSLVLRAFIYIKSGDEVKQLNNEQVKLGLAYVKNDDVINKEQQEKLKETETQAKEQNLGIWSDKELIVDGTFNSKYIKEGQESLLENK